MFTGIVEEIGIVKEIVRRSASVRISVSCAKALEGTRTGDSISVNGICLTVSELRNGWFAADVMPETVRNTGLARLRPGDRVNLERALRLSDRLGGHIVSGHIDGTGSVADRTEEENAIWLTVNAPDKILRYIVERGSVALDGTSLTVAYVDERRFKVSLIPVTARDTVLGRRRPGDEVNIECDVIGKYVEKLLGQAQNRPEESIGVSMDLLRENGFL
ncbi:MAG: riboflavin synthase [Bacillota bacterium]